MTRRPIVSRRAFLGSIGAAGMGSLIPTMEAEAQTAGVRKRLIMLTSGNGCVPADWTPTGSNTALTLSKALAPLEPSKADVIALNGLGWGGDGPGVDHMRIATMWMGSPMLAGNDFSNSTGTRPCGWGSSISIDQAIANKLSETIKTPFKSLEFGVYLPRHHIYTRVNYAASNQPIPPVDDPYAMFDRVFKNIGPATNTGDLDKIRLRRKSIMDAVKGNLTAIQSKVSVSDRAKLDAHLTAVRNIETRLDGTMPVGCAPPALGNKLDHRATANFPAISRLQMDLLVASLLCDVTRVTSLLWAGAANEVRFTWLGQTQGHHTISHDNGANGKTQRTAAHVWFSGEVNYLLQKLKAVPDGTGTLLDNSLVVWGNELSDGAAHNASPIPVLLAGRAGGALKTGRFIDYGRGKKHNGLLVSMAQLMGVTDITKFGSLDDGTGPLSGLV